SAKGRARGAAAERAEVAIIIGQLYRQVAGSLPVAGRIRRPGRLLKFFSRLPRRHMEVLHTHQPRKWLFCGEGGAALPRPFTLEKPMDGSSATCGCEFSDGSSPRRYTSLLIPPRARHFQE